MSKENTLTQTLGFVQGKGSSNTPVSYSFSDKNLNSGKYQYRLKQIDHNNNFEYHNLSSSVEISVPSEFTLSQNYPNPFNPSTKIDFALPFDSKVFITIFDITGKSIKTLIRESRSAGYHTVTFNSANLSTGIYLYRITANSATQYFSSTRKMIIMK
jgi:hypothetical protein